MPLFSSSSEGGKSTGGEMGALVRSFDWAATAIGPIAGWPVSLHTLVDMLLEHPFPTILLWGPQLTQIYNDGYRIIAAAKHPKALGQPTRDCWPEVWHINQPIYEKVLSQGESVKLDDQLFPITRHGYLEDAWFTLSYSPTRDESGQRVGVLLTIIETTDRKKTELALLRSEERARALLSATSYVVYRMSPDWTEMRALDGRGFLSDTGQPSNAWLDTYIHPDDQARVKQTIETAIQSKVLFELEHRVRRADGTLGWTLSRAVPLLDKDGKIVKWFGAASDVTARREAVEALRRNEEEFRTMADNINQLAWICDTLGSVTWYNKRWLDYTGMDFEEVKGWDWTRVQHPDHVDHVIAGVKRSAETGEPREDTFPLRGRDGQFRWFLSRAVPIRDAAGTIVRWFGTNTDITELREAQNALDTAREAAENANRAKDRFLAVLSHELRTPLSPVVMTIPAIELDPDLPYKFREDLTMIRRNIELEVKLIDDLLDLSRIASGKLRLQLQPVHVHELLRHAIHTSFSETAGKRLNVRHDLRASDDRLSGDPARLQQVFWNLLRNAVKFTPDGGDVIVRTWNAIDSGRLHIEVRDTGIGIEPEMVSRIFDAFEQGEARMTRQFGGLGLGLAIAKAVVEMHGGEITVASEGRGKGSSFTIVMDAVPADLTNASGMNTSSASPSQETPRCRVLLVEDHPDTARTLAKLLKNAGFDVKPAGSVASALQLAASEPFDVVVSGIGLPDATGYEMMKRIRDSHGIKGIALSGYGMEEDIRKSRDAGFIDHMVKPVNVNQLQAVIRRVIASEANGAPG